MHDIDKLHAKFILLHIHIHIYIYAQRMSLSLSENRNHHGIVGTTNSFSIQFGRTINANKKPEFEMRKFEKTFNKTTI